MAHMGNCTGAIITKQALSAATVRLNLQLRRKYAKTIGYSLTRPINYQKHVAKLTSVKTHTVTCEFLKAACSNMFTRHFDPCQRRSQWERGKSKTAHSRVTVCSINFYNLQIDNGLFELISVEAADSTAFLLNSTLFCSIFRSLRKFYADL